MWALADHRQLPLTTPSSLAICLVRRGRGGRVHVWEVIRFEQLLAKQLEQPILVFSA